MSPRSSATPAPRPALVLLSGGMDSAVCLAEARAAGFEAHALTVAYGQRHACELEAARRVAEAGGAASQRLVAVDLAALGGSALTSSIPVPKDREAQAIGTGVPATYVPARNTVFLSLALAAAEVLGAHDVYLGVNAVDYSGYPDCRPAFLEAFERLARVATAQGVEGGEPLRLHAPLVELSKAEIVLRAEALGVDLGLTHTCYDPVPVQAAGGSSEHVACGRCDACLLRLQGFAAAGRADPLSYANA